MVINDRCINKTKPSVVYELAKPHVCTFSSSLSGIAMAVLGSGQISRSTNGSLSSSATPGLISTGWGSVGFGELGSGALGELGSGVLGELGGCSDSWHLLVLWPRLVERTFICRVSPFAFAT